LCCAATLCVRNGCLLRCRFCCDSAGVHIVVATPGRLKDLLSKRRMNLDICRSALMPRQVGNGQHHNRSCLVGVNSRQWPVRLQLRVVRGGAEYRFASTHLTPGDCCTGLHLLL
jgi:hypothetical protein